MRSVKRFEDVDALVTSEWDDKPHCWIQWKGTNVCMDMYCVCGYHSHIHASFAYTVQCPECKRVFSPNAYIELIELTEEDNIHVVGE